MTVLRGRVVTGDAGGVLADGVVAFDGPRLDFVGPASEFGGALPSASDAVVLPGLVDVHCHGGGGHGFPEADSDGIAEAARFHIAHGSTTLVASLVSATESELAERIGALAPSVDAGLLAGIHLEGPFLSERRCGAHDPTRIAPGDPAMLRRLVDRAAGRIVSMTLAPETDHADELIEILAAARIVVSLGHTAASFARSLAALETCRRAGARVSITHLFNAMTPLAHRGAGFLTAALAAAGRGEAVAEIIGDGVHVDDGTVRMVFDTVGAANVALVTDAMAAAGQPDGRYRLGTLDVDVRGGVARLHSADGGETAIAGGTATTWDLLRRTVFHAGAALPHAVRAAAATPARLLGLPDRGTLARDLRADLIVTDDRLTSRTVYRNGELWN